MSDQLRTYLRTFFLMLVATSIMSYFLYYEQGDPSSISKMIFMSVFISFFTTVTMVSLHISSLKELGVDVFDKAALSTHQNAEIVTSLGLAELYDKLFYSKINYFTKFKKFDDKVLISSKPSIESWGELIEIKMLGQENGGYRYAIKSRPRICVTLIDMGKNMKNIIAIKEIINS